jgi:hypothetical protein
MKRVFLLSVLFVAATIGDALAACTGSPIAGSNLTNLLNGKLVCGRPAEGYTGSANDRWQEEHLAGGDLYDYKKGTADKVDPRVKVGTWATSGNQVTHSYDTKSYNYTVHLISGNTYSFCTKVNGTEVVRANIVSNTNAGCGGTFP